MSFRVVALLVGFILFPASLFTQKQQPQKPQPPKPSEALLEIMQAELARADSALSKADPAPYYIAYAVYDDDAAAVMASMGGVLTSVSNRRRMGDVILRVGAHQLDNTHNESRGTGISSSALPLTDDRAALALELWRLTDRQYKQAAQALVNVKTQAAVRAKEEDDSGDFSKETVSTWIAPRAAITFDRAPWEKLLTRVSNRFKQFPWVYQSVILLTANQTQKYFVSTDGARTHTTSRLFRVMVMAQTTAEDGMELMRAETFEAPDGTGLPSETVLAAKVEKIAADLKALRAAPLAEPFNGPALLSGRSAAVFFHEVLGHRLEGQRQRGDEEGQTFTKQLGKPVLPAFLSVADDPTIATLDNISLAGFYPVDDEGVAAKRVNLIENGILKQFLMSRRPIKSAAQSNGHGRRQPGAMAVARQGNLFVTSSKSVPEPELRKRLVEEIRKQGKPYGLYFEDIQGGFTLTTRSLPQSFQVLPVMVWKVFADGKADELVRGVDIVGTPLASLTRISAAGDQTFVFNGVCGAESGQVPVAAAAPALLFSEMEVQRKPKGQDRPPILPPPAAEAGKEPR